MIKPLFKKIAVALFISILIGVHTGCQNRATESSTDNKKDSLVINNDKLRKAATLFKGGILPMVVDTTFLFKIEKGDSLGGFEIRTLTDNCYKHGLMDHLEYNLKNFFSIDSIKAAGKYQEYCDSLDIGMTKTSTAHALQEIQLDSNTLLLIWGLYTSSYEACPYFTTYAGYFTVIYKGNVAETFLLGQYISAGDPPTAMRRTVNGKIQADGVIMLDVTEINDQDMDLPEVNITKEEYSLKIIDGKIKSINEKKESPRKVDRKKVGF
jgi:hypothetical protein